METYLVGRGIADITGEAADAGMLGYGKKEQRTTGIHTRLRSRAFVFATETDRILLVVNDLPLLFDSIHRAVLDRLATRFGDRYTERNVMLTATHTHCGPGGYSHHHLYNSTTNGFRRKTFEAIVDGIVEAVEHADADIAPATLRLNSGELHDASVNRSRSAFDLNPPSDKAHFPDAIDPQTTLLRIERDGTLVGAVNWFATHNTSMTNTNTLISADNKGYAEYHWERIVSGVDYRTAYDDETGPSIVAALAQTNAGDMSPNLRLKPGHGPTDDEFENTRIIGSRQYDAAAALAADPGTPIDGVIDSRTIYVDLARVDVAAAFTGSGRSERTSGPTAGASSLAGAQVDGPGFPGFREGRNPVWDGLSRQVFYRFSRRLRASQSPKGIALPGGLLNRVRPMVADRAPVQLLRIGQLYLIGIPGEVTIVAGLRLRRTVAAIVGADLEHVLVAGYSNGYIHYVTTPEEYDAQQYEGGSTLFGRWELPALQQIASSLAVSMRDGTVLPAGARPTDPVVREQKSVLRTRVDATPTGRGFGDVQVQPDSSYAPGSRVTVEFVGAYPNNDLRRGDTYVTVQRQAADEWETVADDADWSTIFRWRRGADATSVATITWDIPPHTRAGRYRIGYNGDAVGSSGQVDGFRGTSAEFDVS
ncbi:neutral/alkaline ceramidase [Antrihabitans cavernicola]|uniref:Neutral ceramidase n=1 Tax=Antrihabitans cavernicola TaxID=2495913 RepID=A0A5A7S7E6_9NOCA|nr:neutral/alkaline ceramidase [Spelaeibacter cavernicola]KAA0017392.1 alkaline ceramidase [Spelaeibacter cavernicola]